ncbi:hypothetical protein ATANTOWER_027543 [Ataeniobius toweri]|uniref:Uncharacterized protein n=1 Tax=Ataeniobius toweri TaxID=208326 RepID=A0ABU7B0P6_9TELE|nr:hypothetical protein [Ataeniobius toweri]
MNNSELLKHYWLDHAGIHLLNSRANEQINLLSELDTLINSEKGYNEDTSESELSLAGQGETVHSLGGAALCHSLLLKKEKKNTHVTVSWVWLHTDSQIQVLLNKIGSGQILIQHTHQHLAFKDTKISWGANSLLPRTPPHTHKFLLSLHSNHPNATLRQDDNSVNSS